MAPPAGRIVGNYALGALIGRGGMSEVYAARHRFLGDEVAVKLLRGDRASDDAATAAFVAEAARTRAIEHDGVVRVVDFGKDDASGSCYLVMERIDGETLAARLRRDGRLGEVDARRLGAAIADGMQAAHERGIVHRDLKPANVMLRGDRPTIVDFGIAKHLGDRSAVATGRRIGTPAYMAPEQFTGGMIAPCVDVWALGVILFEAVTGRAPFDGFDDGRCPQLFETAPRAGALAAVSAELDDLIARCLEREPGRRPSSMKQIAAELRGEADAERITRDAGPIAAPAALPAPPRRRSWPIVAGVAAVAIAVGLVAASRSGGSEPEAAPIDAGKVDARREPDAAPAPAPVKTIAIDAGVPDRKTPSRPRKKPRRPPPRDPNKETLD